MNIDYAKNNGLVPAIIQDATTNKVLMLGYMNEDAVKKTIDTNLVTFLRLTWLDYSFLEHEKLPFGRLHFFTLSSLSS